MICLLIPQHTTTNALVVVVRNSDLYLIELFLSTLIIINYIQP